MPNPEVVREQRAPSARVNLLANYLGRIANGVCSVAFIPLYVKYLGIEAFGLVGFYTSLIGVLAIFDLGMNATITRELTNTDIDDKHARRSKDLVRTLGGVYWLIALLLACGVALSASWLSENWLNVHTLSRTTVEQSIALMGITLAGQMLLGFYSAGLFGLQRHVTCNLIISIVTAARTAGATLVLWGISSTITAFFVWQAITVFAGLITARFVLQQYLPAGRAYFRWGLLREVWQFAAGAFTASMSSVLLSQTDKIVLSRMLPLTEFGYYTFAVSAASALQYLSSPLFTTFFPSFSRKVATSNQRDLEVQYHRASQILAVAVLPAGFLLVLFSRPLVFAWTGNAELTANASPIMSLLALGMTFSAIRPLTYSLQLAHGWTRLSVVANGILFAGLLLMLLTLVPVYGAGGAAAAWTIANGLYLVGTVWVMHRRILIGEQMRWYVRDLLPAASTVFILGVSLHFLVTDSGSRVSQIIWVGAVYLILLTASALSTPETRKIALDAAERLRRVTSPRIAMCARAARAVTSKISTLVRTRVKP